jgi:hypothetical protein
MRLDGKHDFLFLEQRIERTLTPNLNTTVEEKKVKVA